MWVKNTVPAGRICALVLLANKCSTTTGDTMESGHIKIYEPHHLGLLKMLSASVLDGQTCPGVETRAGHENRGRGRISQLLQFCLKSCRKNQVCAPVQYQPVLHTQVERKHQKRTTVKAVLSENSLFCIEFRNVVNETFGIFPTKARICNRLTINVIAD